MPAVSLPLRQRGFGETTRRDRWWLTPVGVFVGLSAFVVYSTWAALQGQHYTYGPYLSPFYSPELWGPSPHAWFGTIPSWWPDWLPYSPAMLILWAPAGFRLTCYYYRGAYYKAFWGDPVNCAVGEPGFRGKNFRGERWLPLSFMNIHRYFLYGALIFNVILTYDAVLSYIFVNADGSHRFGIGVGSLVITLNAVLLASYSFGCHSLRHLVGGVKDCVSASPLRHKTYDCVSCFNRWHMQWAWISLFWVCFTDLYIRLCSMGIWSDWRIL